MPTKTITIPLDPDAAKAFRAAPPADQKKIKALLGIWLRDLTKAESADLKKLMDDVSRHARAQGLTPEILESLLKDA
ncbi:MAG: hypothetical protein DMG21_05320 [Acidobacteria bacterium]|nr:MAG: hypothetical protein DMG21_05320 [Acidobacteriota bacterium]